jgi:hypothetical protein
VLERLKIEERRFGRGGMVSDSVEVSEADGGMLSDEVDADGNEEDEGTGMI